MQLSLPKGYQLPDGVKAGEPFEAVATITANPDGTFTLSAIDGTDLDTEDEAMEEMPEEQGEPAEAPMGRGKKAAQMVQAFLDNQDAED